MQVRVKRFDVGVDRIDVSREAALSGEACVNGDDKKRARAQEIHVGSQFWVLGSLELSTENAEPRTQNPEPLRSDSLQIARVILHGDQPADHLAGSAQRPRGPAVDEQLDGSGVADSDRGAVERVQHERL